MTVAQVDPCSTCGSTSPFHRLHPVSGTEIDYTRSCGSCRHFRKSTTSQAGQKRTEYSCGKVGRIDHPGQVPHAYPGCTLWTSPK